ncbi:MAG TPA: ATP-binding protein [Candidatus Kapabacteria bacterium]
MVTIAITALNALLWLRTGQLDTTVAICSAVCIVLSLIGSHWFARVLVRPIAELRPTVGPEGKIRTEDRSPFPIELHALRQAIEHISERMDRNWETRQKLERIRSEFLANVSHELRTPIFAVKGFVETLLDGAIDDPNVNRDFLERAHAQAERLSNLLNDLIDISRIESGEMRMSFRMFDLQPFLREFVQEVQPLARAKAIELYFTGNILPHHEVNAYADKERLKQVLFNLVDNAIKYSGRGAAIKIELLNGEPEPQLVSVRVSDTGVGIAPEHLPRLFERFYRIDKDRVRSAPGGTGLGLAIVKHIVEAHRGHISVQSEPHKGSTFQFTLQKRPL